MKTQRKCLTGIQLGMSLLGKTILMARVDFSLLGFDQLINNALNGIMFGGKMNVPIVMGHYWKRMDSQTSQSLESVFHILFCVVVPLQLQIVKV